LAIFFSITETDFITTDENTLDSFVIILGIILIGLILSVVSGLLIKKYSNRGFS
jgi:NhaP-type Na+/H+ or K+/H+ antiporter